MCLSDIIQFVSRPEFNKTIFLRAVSTAYLLSNEPIDLDSFIEKRKKYHDDPRCTDLFKDYYKVEVSEVLGSIVNLNLSEIEKVDESNKRFCLNAINRTDDLAKKFLVPEEANGPDLQSRHDLLREILSR